MSGGCAGRGSKAPLGAGLRTGLRTGLLARFERAAPLLKGLLLGLLPALGGLLAACGRSGEPAGGARAAGERALYELERMVWVPPGAPRVRPGVGVAQPLLADRFELTRADWEHWFGVPPERGGLDLDQAVTSVERGAWPAFMTFAEAEEVARRRGMRLPTWGEWLYLAVGRGSLYPWGRRPERGIANTSELGLQRPLPVGCFERGDSWVGAYDLVGNVMEWVADGIPTGGSAGAERGLERAAVGLDPALLAFAMGGSFATRMRAPYEARGAVFSALGFTPETRSPEIGVRCVVEAQVWLAEHADALLRAPDALARLERVGARFGAQAAPALERWSPAEQEHLAFRALLAGARR